MENLENIIGNTEIKARVPETNVFMREKYAIYILSGNAHSIPLDPQDPHEIERLSGIEQKEKEPHDIIVPMYVFHELDNIKDNPKKTAKEKALARDALKILENLIKTYIGTDLETFKSEKENFFKKGIILDNGAKVFFPDISLKEFGLRYKSAIPPKDDDYIIHTAKLFQEQNPQYKKFVVISNDINVRNKSMLLGIEADEFRYGKVKNPLQQNKGIAYSDVNHKTYELLKKLEEIDLNQEKLPVEFETKPNPKFLITNQVIGFRKKRKKYNDEKDMYDIHFMRFTEDKKLIQLKYYNEFIEFYNNFRSESEIKARERLEEKKEQYTTGSSLETKVNQDQTEKEIDERFTHEYLKELLESTFNKGYLTRSKKREFSRKLERIKNRMPLEKHATYHSIHSSLTQLITNKEKPDEAFKNKKERRKEQRIIDEKFLLRYSFNRDIQPEAEQIVYIDHLLNPDIFVTSIDATGGFGKTLWASAVGLYMLHKERIDQIVYITTETKTNLGRDPGALPGTLREKIEKKTKPFADNIEVLLSYNSPQKIIKAQEYLKELENSGKLTFEIPQSMTGVSKQRYFFIIDDAHFYSKDDMITFLGRGGEGTYFVIAGGMEQLPYISEDVNKNNNGLIHCVADLYGNPLYAHLSATGGKTHRGPGAELAAILGGRKSK